MFLVFLYSKCFSHLRKPVEKLENQSVYLKPESEPINIAMFMVILQWNELRKKL